MISNTHVKAKSCSIEFRDLKKCKKIIVIIMMKAQLLP